MKRLIAFSAILLLLAPAAGAQCVEHRGENATLLFAAGALSELEAGATVEAWEGDLCVGRDTLANPEGWMPLVVRGESAILEDTLRGARSGQELQLRAIEPGADGAQPDTLLLSPDQALVYQHHELWIVSDVGLAPLPIELVRFTAQLDGQAATLQWETATEADAAGFHVERAAVSTNGASGPFEILGFVEAAGPGRYEYDVGRLRPGRWRFRLEQLDLDGRSEYSSVIELDVAAGETRLEATWPNPVESQATITFTLERAKEVRLELFDTLGRRVATIKDGHLAAGRHDVELEASRYASGLYFLRLKAGGYAKTKRLIVTQ